jgi:hypothetical protein
MLQLRDQMTLLLAHHHIRSCCTGVVPCYHGRLYVRMLAPIMHAALLHSAAFLRMRLAAAVG